MLECIAAPKSKINAREILKAELRTMHPQPQNPSILDVVNLADILGRERGLYVSADYLLQTWAELFKR